MGITERECKICGKTLPIEEFYKFKQRDGRTGYYGKCKGCYKVYTTEVKNGKKIRYMDIPPKPAVKVNKAQDTMNLEEANKDAWNKNMSYGQWEAQRYMKKMKEQKQW